MNQHDDLIFSSHNLAMLCYEVSEVFVSYAGATWNPVRLTRARAWTAADADRYPNAKIGSYRPFPGPLALHWRARDGAPVDCVLDLAAMFPGHIVRHGEPATQLDWPAPLLDEPTVIVELIDRRVQVYLHACIALVPEAGSRLRRLRTHRVLAWSATC